ncbi:MAG: DUF881 domain-containing protein [Chloroflexi bacterium]|nr:DUF881 domain-containing protein [Chloroflexota bacterium]
MAVILGFLVVAQLRGQVADASLAQQSAQDLTLLVANLNTQNEELRGEVATLEQQLTSLSDTHARGNSAAGQLRADLDRIQGWAGLRAVNGPGISIRVAGQIGGDGVEDLLNELRNAGAEAISVGGVRVVPGTVVAGAAGALFVESTVLGGTFEIRAIGSPQILTGSLTRAGGIVAQLSVTFPRAQVSVTPLDSVAIPATDRDLAPVNGRPSL